MEDVGPTLEPANVSWEEANTPARGGREAEKQKKRSIKAEAREGDYVSSPGPAAGPPGAGAPTVLPPPTHLLQVTPLTSHVF